MEKCYRDIQTRGMIAGLNILEVFILIGVPLLLFPIFTLLNLNFGIILIIEILLYTIFRLAARVSHFDYGLASFIYSKLIWPKRLSAYRLDETKYLKNNEMKFQITNNKNQINSKNPKRINSKRVASRS